VRAVVEHDDGWRVALETVAHGRTRRRSLQAETCNGLVNATAWILALMIDPELTREEEPSPAEVPATDPTAVVPPAAANPEAASPSVPGQPSTAKSTSPAAVEPVARDGKHAEDGQLPMSANARVRSAAPVFWIGPVIALDAGIAPQLGAGLGGTLGANFSIFRVALSIVDGLGARTTDIADPKGAYGSFHLLTGQLTACPTFAVGRAEFSPCATFGMGQIDASAQGVTHSQPNSSLWVGAGPGVAVALRLGSRWRAEAGVDALVSLSRPRFYVRNVEGDVFRPGGVTGSAWIGPEVLF
jgi:hypothetical protein